MARYTIRIELHDAEWEQYEAMYEHLEAQGIIDIIEGGDGVRYKMPPAEYNYDGKATREQVLDMARSSASKVVRKYAVFSTESAGRTWHGLVRV